MYLLYIAAGISLLCAFIYFISEVFNQTDWDEREWGKAFGGFFITLVISLIISGCLNLLVSLIMVNNGDFVVDYEERYNMAKTDGYEQFAYIAPSNDSQSSSQYLRLTYIKEGQPAQFATNIGSARIYDLEADEKPCLVTKHYRSVESKWHFFSWHYSETEIHINQNQIGVIYEKQKKRSVEKE